MKFFLSVLFLSISNLLWCQIPIAEARNAANGTTVTIEGIILNGPEGGQLRFIQDETAAIALFDGLNGSVSLQSLTAGDRVLIEGEKTVYQGLVELNKINSVDYISPNNPLPEPTLIGFDEIGIEHQSERIRLKCATINSSFTFFNQGSYEISNQANSNFSKITVFEDSDIIGTSIPDNSVEIVAINSYANEGELIILNQNDLLEKECLGFVQEPKPVAILKNEVNFEWTLTEAANTDILFGDDPQNLSLYDALENEKDNSIIFENLQPGVIYYCQFLVGNGQDEVQSVLIPFATQSNSSGEIEVYFNNEVDASFSDGSSPNSTSAAVFDSRLFQLFDEAEESIDIAMYNINRTIIVNYLIDAFNRGVQIRYIADDQTNNNAFNTITPPFGLVYGNEGSALMHNKFVIIDAAVEDKAKLITGSTNFTNNQMSTDPNHMLVIHDQSLAKAYTMEFNEMWGSDTETPDIAAAKFGNEKSDNTPHYFNVNGILVESYFSPSDRLTDKIEREIRNTDHTMDIGVLTLTKNELGSAIVDQFDNDIDVRVIIENFDDIGTEYNFLKNNGVDVRTHPTSPIYHHKLAIFDEGKAQARVLTGSHNWTNKAEFENDENTLIIHDQSIANIFRQEYEARWSSLPTHSYEFDTKINIYPNPATATIFLEVDQPYSQVNIVDLQGQLVFQSNIQLERLNIEHLTAGSYFLEILMDDQMLRKLLIKQ